MEGARLKWRRTTTATLLGFLPLTLLIPGAFALRCHSYTSIQPVSRDQNSSEFFVAPSVVSDCFASQNACAEAHLMLSTENTTLLVTHKGCASEGLKDQAESSTSGDHQHLIVQSRVRYCRSDLCNGEPVDLNAFKVPKQDKESEASSSNQCYSGFTMDPDEDILDKVTCGREDSQCYHGNGSITVGHLAVDFLIKTCQEPSCNVPESQSFGPIELKLWGSCCHGIVCNGKVAAAQSQANSTTQNATRPREEDTITQPTDSPKHSTMNKTQDVFAVPEEVTVTLDHKWDNDTGTTTRRNPLYDYEENEDDSQLPVSTNNTLNPRAHNLSPPNPSLPFYLLLVALGIMILRIWDPYCGSGAP